MTSQICQLLGGRSQRREQSVAHLYQDVTRCLYLTPRFFNLEGPQCGSSDFNPGPNVTAPHNLVVCGCRIEASKTQSNPNLAGNQ